MGFAAVRRQALLRIVRRAGAMAVTKVFNQPTETEGAWPTPKARLRLTRPEGSAAIACQVSAVGISAARAG